MRVSLRGEQRCPVPVPVLRRHGHPVLAALLACLRQASDRDPATHAEPGREERKKHQTATWFRLSLKSKPHYAEVPTDELGWISPGHAHIQEILEAKAVEQAQSHAPLLGLFLLRQSRHCAVFSFASTLLLPGTNPSTSSLWALPLFFLAGLPIGFVSQTSNMTGTQL